MGLRQQSKVQSIMIIEDEEDILLVYRDFLEKKGYTIEASAPTANEVLYDYDLYQPDLVIIDYRLPGSMNGLEAAEKIMRQDPEARILMITAYENVKEELYANKFFSDKHVFFMSKPVQLANLVRFIASL